MIHVHVEVVRNTKTAAEESTKTVVLEIVNILQNIVKYIYGKTTDDNRIRPNKNRYNFI